MHGFSPSQIRSVGIRVIEGTKVFRNQADRKDFLEEVAELCAGGAWVIYAWALMANLAQAR
jgi:hypothetical protein